MERAVPSAVTESSLPWKPKPPAGRRFRLQSFLIGLWRFASVYPQLHAGAFGALGRDIRRALGLLFTEGPLKLIARLRFGTYARLIAETIHARPWNEILDRSSAFRLQSLCPKPLQFSLIVDARNASTDEARKCLESVRAQYWTGWEILLLVPDTHAHHYADLAGHDWLTVLVVRATSSSAEVWNTGLAGARGDWVGILPAQTELTPDALTWLLVSANRWPQVHCIYSDSVTLDRNGRCVSSQFKPDFSPEYLLASHFTGDLTVFSRTGLQPLGGLREEFGLASRYDLELRLVETFGADAVQHLQRAVCHRRGVSTHACIECRALETRAAEDFLFRRGVNGRVEPHPVAENVNRVVLIPDASPHVSIYIATRNAASLVQECVRSIRENTEYPNYDIVVIDNRSDEAELLDWLEVESNAGRLSVFDYDRPFNHSEMHNLAIQESESEFVVLINNDIEIISPDWLDQIVATAQSDATIASVGTLLLYPDGSAQHAGIVGGFRGVAGHYHRGLSVEEPGYNGRLHALQEVTACTGALLLLRRSAFVEVGGFDSRRLPTSFNDVDLGLRLRSAGYRCIYNPAVQAFHFESKSRRIDHVQEREFHQTLLADWAQQLERDPFHNENLSLFSDSFRLFRSNPPNVDDVAHELQSLQPQPQTRHEHTAQKTPVQLALALNAADDRD